MPAAGAAKDVYAPDLKVTRYTMNSGNFTISNVGTKNSPTGGFDVLLYCQYLGGGTYKSVYHCDDVIAPGYSRTFKGFQGSYWIEKGLIRVNPYKKFYECDYDNNVRYFKLIKSDIPSYTATEQSYYDGGGYWEYWYYSYNYGRAWIDGNSTNCSNGGYSPLLSTNPIASGYYYYNNRGKWVWKATPLYVNAVQIYQAFQKAVKINYVTVSGVTNNSNMRIYVDVGYAKFLTYNPTKHLWEGYIGGDSSKLKDAFRVKIYSIRTGQNATDDITNYVSHVKVSCYHIKNAWQWKY